MLGSRRLQSGAPTFTIREEPVEGELESAMRRQADLEEQQAALEVDVTEARTSMAQLKEELAQVDIYALPRTQRQQLQQMKTQAAALDQLLSSKRQQLADDLSATRKHVATLSERLGIREQLLDEERETNANRVQQSLQEANQFLSTAESVWQPEEGTEATITPDQLRDVRAAIYKTKGELATARFLLERDVGDRREKLEEDVKRCADRMALARLNVAQWAAARVARDIQDGIKHSTVSTEVAQRVEGLRKGLESTQAGIREMLALRNTALDISPVIEGVTHVMEIFEAIVNACVGEANAAGEERDAYLKQLESHLKEWEANRAAVTAGVIEAVQKLPKAVERAAERGDEANAEAPHGSSWTLKDAELDHQRTVERVDGLFEAVGDLEKLQRQLPAQLKDDEADVSEARDNVVARLEGVAGAAEQSLAEGRKKVEAKFVELHDASVARGRGVEAECAATKQSLERVAREIIEQVEAFSRQWQAKRANHDRMLKALLKRSQDTLSGLVAQKTRHQQEAVGKLEEDVQDAFNAAANLAMAVRTKVDDDEARAVRAWLLATKEEILKALKGLAKSHKQSFGVVQSHLRNSKSMASFRKSRDDNSVQALETAVTGLEKCSDMVDEDTAQTHQEAEWTRMGAQAANDRRDSRQEPTGTIIGLSAGLCILVIGLLVLLVSIVCLIGKYNTKLRLLREKLQPGERAPVGEFRLPGDLDTPTDYSDEKGVSMISILKKNKTNTMFDDIPLPPRKAGSFGTGCAMPDPGCSAPPPHVDAPV
eukprot:GHVT01000577.1.p1 GENE.GHVT01000577.1~~GHVT01000577.1.p1  ORF type:complete len:782 (-),score=183.85 GHVT01000577.1:127-2442(-)